MFGTDSRGVRNRGLFRVFSVLAAVFMVLVPGQPTGAAQPIIVENDAGGAVATRIALIDTYRQSGVRVEIRGDVCLSACTLYLGLDNTCVSPGTTFGFHGPSSGIYGVALSPVAFERWSQVMAEYYPKPLRKWFLDRGRHRIVGFHEFSGNDLIEMGITPCVDL